MDQKTLGFGEPFLKKLQELSEQNWQFISYAEMKGVVRRVESPSEIFLLLHGLGERGKRIYRKLIHCLPDDALVIAPNGPFPVDRPKNERMDYGHSWYFYDKIERKYFITQDLAKFWLRDLLKIENPNSLPVTIIGFSQGGYLAPVAGQMIKETKLIIGLSCEFRNSLIEEKPLFPMVAIHGDSDDVVAIESSINEIAHLKTRGIPVDFHCVSGTGHTISSEVALNVKNILETYGKRNL